MNHVRVDLLERNEFKMGSAERGLKEAAIFQDVFVGVPFHEAEIEDFFGFERAYAARACAEAVNEPGKLEQRGEFENLQAAALAEAPWRRNAGYRRLWRRGLARPATPQRSFSCSHNQTSIIATAGTQKSRVRRPGGKWPHR